MSQLSSTLVQGAHWIYAALHFRNSDRSGGVLGRRRLPNPSHLTAPSRNEDPTGDLSVALPVSPFAREEGIIRRRLHVAANVKCS
jgi:hypothetical protein